MIQRALDGKQRHGDHAGDRQDGEDQAVAQGSGLSESGRTSRREQSDHVCDGRTGFPPAQECSSGLRPHVDVAVLQKGAAPRSQQGPTGSGAGHCSCRRLLFLAPQREAGPPRARTGGAEGAPEIALKPSADCWSLTSFGCFGAQATGLRHPAPCHCGAGGGQPPRSEKRTRAPSLGRCDPSQTVRSLTWVYSSGEASSRPTAFDRGSLLDLVRLWCGGGTTPSRVCVPTTSVTCP